MNPQSLYQSPNSLAQYYTRFGVETSVQLTGHSHQAWPDCAREGHIAAWDDAARYGDDKWTHAFAQAERVQQGFARLTNDTRGHYTLGESTHTLLVRWLSALPLRAKPKLVTTDGEFHSTRRQLARLVEEGIAVLRVPVTTAKDCVARLIAAIDPSTAGVVVSSVFYQSGLRLPELAALAAHCRTLTVPLMVDVYHHLNVVPFDIEKLGLTDAFLIGGGYKYCQLGEGNCFLRLPPDCDLRPVITGWFSEFAELSKAPASQHTAYADGPARFAGATYDPTANYRAAAVFDFFTAQGLTPELLHEVNQHQQQVLADAFDRLNADPARIDRDRSLPLSARGGFMTFATPHAARITDELARRHVRVDFRGNTLRMGPAPYLSDRQLGDAIAALQEVLTTLR